MARGLSPQAQEATVVDRLNDRLKQFRRTATRYEKRATNHAAINPDNQIAV